MLRLDDFDNIFVNIMLTMCLGFMLSSAFGLLPENLQLLKATAGSWTNVRNVVFIFLALFLIKYLQGISVLRFRFKNVSDVPNESPVAHVFFFLTRVVFLGSTYYLIFNLLKTTNLKPENGKLVMYIFYALVIFGYVTPAFFLAWVARDATKKWYQLIEDWIRGIRPVKPISLKNVFQKWCWENIFNLIILLLMSERFGITFEMLAIIFFFTNTIGDWFWNWDFFFGTGKMELR